MAIQDIFPTTVRLNTWGAQMPLQCLLCEQKEESAAHLFFDFSYNSLGDLYKWTRNNVKRNKEIPQVTHLME
ncbi:putative cytochrome P450 CYP44 [Bienertia sinuspersici]